MKNKKETIKKFISWINNEEENGGLWLPNIQRFFIWKEEQIEALFDSIMREYPIGNLLIWKTKEQIKIRKFVDNYRDNLRLIDYYVSKNNKMKLIVLDGQQRIQSLFIGLKGSYNNNQLYFNLLSKKEGKEQKEDIIYEFKFKESELGVTPDGWVMVKDIIEDKREYDEIAESIVEKTKINSDEEKKLIRKNILKLIKEFRDKENIAYTELDSVDNPETYKLNDVVEIFIRANAGGTPLSKSDLMFSLLTADWEKVDEELSDFLEEINQRSFNVGRDFVLKTSLILIGAGARYDVKKFRDEKNLSELKDKWDKIKESMKIIIDYLTKYTYIRDDRALPSYLALIPLIYFCFKYPDKWRHSDKASLASWLTRVLLTGAFSGSSDSLLDGIIKRIDKAGDFDIDGINAEIMDRGRSIGLTKDALINSYYGEKKSYLIFALWYQNINFKPLYDGNLPWVDHIFPQSILNEIKAENPDTGKLSKKYSRWDRDQIANLMLLSAEENRDEKRATSAEKWLSNKDDLYFDTHLIPRDKELWKIENYEKFIEERKKLLIDKFQKLGIIHH